MNSSKTSDMYKILLTYFVLCLVAVKGQRVAPGVPPQHYQQPPQQYQQHPQAPQQYQQHPQQHNLPPGVNPQQYQQQQMQLQQQQQQQQQQMQFQQVPVQQHQQVPVQQVPVQQQQVPVQQVPVQQQQVPVQQVPQGHGGGHHAPHGHHGQQQVLNAGNIQHEREHIQEHMQVPIDTSKMSEAELQFHYFKMHDSDNNNKLDGCELIKSLIHWHVDEATNSDKKEEGEEEKSGGTGEKNGSTYTDENLTDVIDYVLNTMDLNKDGYVDYTEYRKSEEKSAKDNKQ